MLAGAKRLEEKRIREWTKPNVKQVWCGWLYELLDVELLALGVCFCSDGPLIRN